MMMVAMTQTFLKMVHGEIVPDSDSNNEDHNPGCVEPNDEGDEHGCVEPDVWLCKYMYSILCCTPNWWLIKSQFTVHTNYKLVFYIIVRCSVVFNACVKSTHNYSLRRLLGSVFGFPIIIVYILVIQHI